MPVPKKKSQPIAAGEAGAPAAEPAESRRWWYALAAILIVAALIRIWDLELKPLHHDEGVNGFFLRNLAREGVFRYDPANYHGPTLPYFALVSAKLFGMNTYAIRIVPLLFGLGVIGLALGLYRRLGRTAALASAALLALSPGAIFHSRYFIHEMLLVFFTFALVLAGWSFAERRSEWWLALAGLFTGLIFATKETCIITYAVLLIATVMMWLDRKLLRKDAPQQSLPPLDPKITALSALSGAVIAVAVSVIFYSAFFRYWKGVRDSLHTFEIWAKTGSEAHVHPLLTYGTWLWKMESPILLLAMVGTVFALIRAASDRFALFTALWAWGTFAAYSLVPYKTPWLSLNFLVPLALLAGYGIEQVARKAGRQVAMAVSAVALVVLLYQAWDVNFVRYDDESVPYVYAPTDRQFLTMVRQIERLADRAGTGPLTPVAVLYPEYWPLPWYLRDFKTAEFFGSTVPTTNPIVVASEGVRAQIEPVLGQNYRFIRSYHQRNGLEATLYARRDIVECPVNPDVPMPELIPLTPVR